jgi:hypothetical protein
VFDAAHIAWRLKVACDLDATVEAFYHVR